MINGVLTGCVSDIDGRWVTFSTEVSPAEHIYKSPLQMARYGKKTTTESFGASAVTHIHPRARPHTHTPTHTHLHHPHTHTPTDKYTLRHSNPHAMLMLFLFLCF